MAGNFVGGGNRSTRRKSLTLSHNVVSSTPRRSRIRTHNNSGDRPLKRVKDNERQLISYV